MRKLRQEDVMKLEYLMCAMSTLWAEQQDSDKGVPDSHWERRTMKKLGNSCFPEEVGVHKACSAVRTYLRRD